MSGLVMLYFPQLNNRSLFMIMSQNIFNYATSELSQDAFISLLISWYDSEDETLNTISKDFITRIYDEYNHKYLESRLPKLVFNSKEPVRLIQQHYKIDVFFEVKDEEENKTAFIIEDKTWTEPHSGQLQRYSEKIAREKKDKITKENKYKNVIKIFFKTGHITEKDINETKLAKYLILDTKWIYDFLTSYEIAIDNMIFKDYLEYLKANYYLKLYDEKSGKKLVLGDWKKEYLKEGYVQYALIEAIKNKIVIENSNYIKFTRNGKQWDTWWTFFNKKEEKTQFFIKIKKIKKNYRLRLIEYSNSTNKAITSDICSRIINSLPNTSVKLTPKPRYKATETEIAYLEIIDNELKKYVNDFTEFIEKFIEKVHAL